MGWSVDTVKPELDIIFTSLGIRYKIDHPDSMSPQVYIQYEGELPVTVMKAIIQKFPELVYVGFTKTKFPVGIE